MRNNHDQVNALPHRLAAVCLRVQWMGMEMRTLEVTREFLETCNELAKAAKVPEVKARLLRLADDYRRKLEELERVGPARSRRIKSHRDNVSGGPRLLSPALPGHSWRSNPEEPP
jgi:hypothetical protein